jgi:hypothetical protein
MPCSRCSYLYRRRILTANIHALLVTEIIRHIKQGITRPFLRHAENGEFYFSKGRGIGRRDFIRDWFGSNLAHAFDFPVPESSLLGVPEILIAESDDWNINDLGPGTVFVSREVPKLDDLLHSQLAEVLVDLQRDVIVFDW